MRGLLLILSFIFTLQGFSHSRDSLYSVWEDSSAPDTARAEAMQYFAWSYLFTAPDSALMYAHNELKFSTEKKLPKWEAKSYNTIGLAYMYMAIFDSSYKYLHLALDKRIELRNENDIARSYGNIGILHQYMSNYPAAIEYFMKSLEIKERLNDSLGAANTYNNIGTLYSKINDYENENKFHLKSLNLYTSLKNNQGIARVSHNLGVVQFLLENYKSAQRYFLISKKLYGDLNDQNGTANVLMGLGKLYLENDFCKLEKLKVCPHPQAIKYFEIAKEIFDQSNNPLGISSIELSISEYYKHKGDYVKAKNHALQSLEISLENGLVKESIEVYHQLFKIYQFIGAHEKALDAYIKMDAINDSLFSIQNKNEILRNEIKLNFENKAMADSLKAAEEKKLLDAQLLIKEEQIAREKIQRTALFSGVLVLIVFLFFTYRRYKISNKRKEIIQQQKVLVEEKNKEITDSINYAKRLQDAILPPLETFKEHFPSSFILFKPKDIVSGDFYWMETTETHIFFAAADCTGHGVPGAMVSVVCANALNKAINELGKTDPAEVLNVTRELVIATFAKSGSDVKDGMDISLFSVAHRASAESESDEENENPHTHSHSRSVSWAGANNPLWIIRNGATEVEEIKPDKQPIGLYGELKPFTSHKVELNTGDSIYLFSDGYSDQFGGKNLSSVRNEGKKMKSGNFKKLLLKYKDEEMEQQKMILEASFEDWKGELEQVDDVCVIGVRV